MSPRSLLLYPLIFAALVLSSCVPAVDPRPRALLSQKETQAGTKDKAAPLDVEIAQAFRREGQLNVNVHVTARTAIDPNAVVVTLVGLRDGETVHEQNQSLKTALGTGDSLSAGETASLFFTMPEAHLTEYQVKCSWGDDASGLITSEPKAQPLEVAKSEEVPPSKLESPPVPDPADIPVIQPLVSGKAEMREGDPGRLSLTRVAIEKQELPCSSAPCDLSYTVTGQLVNNTSAVLNSATLALGLYWARDRGPEAEVPKPREPLTKSEEQVALHKLKLAPGASKKIRVKVDRPIPVVPGGSFQAYLRIVEP